MDDFLAVIDDMVQFVIRRPLNRTIGEMKEAVTIAVEKASAASDEWNYDDVKKFLRGMGYENIHSCDEWKY